MQILQDNQLTTQVQILQDNQATTQVQILQDNQLTTQVQPTTKLPPKCKSFKTTKRPPKFNPSRQPSYHPSKSQPGKPFKSLLEFPNRPSFNWDGLGSYITPIPSKNPKKSKTQSTSTLQETFKESKLTTIFISSEIQANNQVQILPRQPSANPSSHPTSSPRYSPTISLHSRPFLRPSSHILDLFPSKSPTSPTFSDQFTNNISKQFHFKQPGVKPDRFSPIRLKTSNDLYYFVIGILLIFLY